MTRVIRHHAFDNITPNTRAAIYSPFLGFIEESNENAGIEILKTRPRVLRRKADRCITYKGNHTYYLEYSLRGLVHINTELYYGVL